MIIIVGSEADHRCAAVIQELQRRKATYTVFDTRDFPYRTQIAFNIDGPGSFKTPTMSAHVPLSEVRSVYYCTNNHFEMLADDPPEIQHIVYNNIESAAWSFLRSLDCLYVNPVVPADMHHYKTHLLKVFRKAGLRVPNTLVTNDPSQIRAFYEANNGNIVCKPPWGQAFTQKVTEGHLTPESLGKLTNSPVMFQELIEGQDYRAYVLNDRTWGVEVRSQTLDLNMDDTATRVAYELPANIAADCVRMREVAGLVWTAVDFRITPGGQHVFFEANSSPDFTTDDGWIPNYNLVGALADVLEAG